MPKGEPIRKYSRKPNRTSRGKTKLLDSTENINQKQTVSNVSNTFQKNKSVKNNSNHHKNNNQNNMPSKSKKNTKDVNSKSRSKRTIENAFYPNPNISKMKPLDYNQIYPLPSKASELMQRAYKEMQRVEGLTEVNSNEKLVMWSVREIQQLKRELESTRNRHVQYINNLRVRMRQIGVTQPSSTTKPKVKTEPSSPSSPRQKDSKLDDFFSPVKQISNENGKQGETISGSKRRRTDTSEQTPPTKRRRISSSKKSSESKKMRGSRRNVVDDDDEYDPSSFGDHVTEEDEDFQPDVVEELTDLSETESQSQSQSKKVKKGPSSQDRPAKQRRDTTKKRRSTPRSKKSHSEPSTPTTPTGTRRRRTRRKEIPTFNDEQLFPEEMEFEEEKTKKGENLHQQFWNHVGLYFEPITSKILERLEPQESEEKDPAFQIPPLGRNYKDMWATEDSTMFDDGDIALKSPQLHEESNWGVTDKDKLQDDDSLGDSLKRMCEEQTTLMNNTIDVKKASDAFNDHSLSQRVLSALVEEPSVPKSSITTNGTIDDDGPDELQPTLASSEDYDEMEMLSLEERLLKELKDIGVLNEEDSVSNIDNREDDEICSHIRSLQSNLRECVNENNKLKRVIMEHVKKEVEVEQQKEAQMQKDQQNLAKYERLMREKKQKGKKGRKTTKRKKQ